MLHDGADNDLKVVFADRALERFHGGIGDLGGNGVLFGVFVVGDGRLAGPVGQHPVHIAGELPVDDDGGIVVTGLHVLHKWHRVGKNGTGWGNGAVRLIAKRVTPGTEFGTVGLNSASPRKNACPLQDRRRSSRGHNYERRR